MINKVNAEKLKMDSGYTFLGIADQASNIKVHIGDK